MSNVQVNPEAIAAAIAICLGNAHEARGVVALTHLEDEALRYVGACLRGLPRPSYKAVPGSTHDWAIRAIRRAQDLAA